jgi:hypothetical protein
MERFETNEGLVRQVKVRHSHPKYSVCGITKKPEHLKKVE